MPEEQAQNGGRKPRKKFDIDAAIQDLVDRGGDRSKLLQDYQANSLKDGVLAARRALRRTWEAAMASEREASKRLTKVAKTAAGALIKGYWKQTLHAGDIDHVLGMIRGSWDAFLATQTPQPTGEAAPADTPQPTGEAAPVSSPDEF